MNNILKKNLLAQKRAFDILGVKYLSPDDKSIINYVNNKISSIKSGSVVVRDSISIGNAFINGINSLDVFNNEKLLVRAGAFASKPFIPVFPDNYSFSCFVSFDVDDVTYKPIIDTGTVQHFKIPKIIDSNSIVHFGHEFIHALKETNYEEYILVGTLSDVITMFYELISTDNDIQLKEDVLNIRMFLLNMELSTYRDSTSFMKKSKNEKDLYKLMQTRSGQYLNSFYYALILYNMYKQNKEFILSMVNKVLNKEISTLDMLQELGIYRVLQTDIFDFELEQVKNVLR